MSRSLIVPIMVATLGAFGGWSSTAQAAPSKKKVKQTAKKCKEDPETCAKRAAAAAGVGGAASGKGGSKTGATPAPPKGGSSGSSNLVNGGSKSKPAGTKPKSGGGGKLNNSSGGGGKLNNSSGGGGKLNNSSSSQPKETRSSPPPPKGGKGHKKSHKGGGKKHKKGAHHKVKHKDGRRGRLGLSGAPRVTVTEQGDAEALVSYGAEFDLFYRYKRKIGPLAALNVETNGVEAEAGVLLGARGMLAPKDKVTPIFDVGLAIQGVPGLESARVGPALRAGVDYAIKKNTSLSFLVGGALYVNQPENEPTSLGALTVGVMLTGWP